MTESFLWFPIALISHFMFAIVFVVDKILLTKSIPQPLRYTFYTAVLGFLIIVVVPFIPEIPHTDILVPAILAAGAQIGALYLFFTALKHGEASRVVPIAGGSAPVFTFFTAAILLGERLQATHVIAFVFLIVGGFILSLRLGQVAGLSHKAWGSALASGLLFALFFTFQKDVYNAYPFLTGLVTVRLIQAILGLVILGPFLIFAKTPKEKKPKTKVPRKKQKPIIASVFLGNKVMSAGAGFLQQYAVSLGSVTLVNALQGTQYVFLLALAVLFLYKFPRLMREELSRVTFVQKITGIILVAVGVVLLVRYL